MPPPKLARDAPILNSVQPVVIHFCPAVGEKLHTTVCHARLRFSDARICQKPLITFPRLNRDVSTFGETDIVLIRLLFLKNTKLVQYLCSSLTRSKAIHAL